MNPFTWRIITSRTKAHVDALPIPLVTYRHYYFHPSDHNPYMCDPNDSHAVPLFL